METVELAEWRSVKLAHNRIRVGDRYLAYTRNAGYKTRLLLFAPKYINFNMNLCAATYGLRVKSLKTN